MGGHGLLLASLFWLQDSDGDKSDDLVVDVSNEVRAGPGCWAALGLGGLKLYLPWAYYILAAMPTLPAACAG